MAEEAKVSTRGLIDTDVGPLRRFKGRLDSLPTEPQTYGQGEGAKASTRITLNYGEVEVLEAIEPYHFPVFQIQMTLSNRKKSRWGVLGESFNDVVDSQYSEEELDPSNPSYIKPSERMDIKDTVGKIHGLVLADGEDGRPEPPMLYDGRAVDAEHPKGQDMPTPAWMVYEVEGVGVVGGKGANPAEVAQALLNDKTLAEFNKEALANPAIRNDTALLQSISMPATAPGSFANSLVKAKLFTKDAKGVYHKVQ